jgi:hypothetical protein
MTRARLELGGLVVACIVSAAAVGSLGLTSPDDAVRFGTVAVLIVVAWHASVVVRVRVSHRDSSAFERAVRGVPPAPVDAPTALTKLDGIVRFARDRAGDVHSRLRPVLRDIAADRLRRSRRIELDRDREAARRLLGAELFELVTAEREPPGDRWERVAIPLDDLTDSIERLEAL